MELRRRILPVLIRALGIKGSRKRNEVRAVGNIKRVNKGYMKRSTCLVIFMKRSTYIPVCGDIHEVGYICGDIYEAEYICGEW